MMYGFTRLLAPLFGLALCLNSSLRSAEPSWPQHLGPQRDGVSRETGLLESWPNDGLQVVWRSAGGVGMSGLSIQGSRLVTMFQDDRHQYVVAKDSKTGKTVWQTEIAPRYENAMGNGPRATPTIDGESVYAFSGEGVLAALDLATGKTRWTHDVVRDQHGKPAEYGMVSSPLVVGNQVLVIAGAPQATVVAYDTKSGSVAWTAGQDPAGYSSLALREVAGGRQLLVFAGNSAFGLSPAGGPLLWRYPYVTDYNCNIATPIVVDGNVLITSGENHGSVLLRLTRIGTQFELSEVWASQGASSTLRGEWQTPVLWDGRLYAFDNVGSAGPVTHLTCVDPANGQRIWQKPRFGKGNLIAADGKLFLSTMKGELVVARATPRGYEELGRMNVLGPTRQAPALAGGLLYLRDDQDIVCLDVGKH